MDSLEDERILFWKTKLTGLQEEEEVGIKKPNLSPQSEFLSDAF